MDSLLDHLCRLRDAIDAADYSLAERRRLLDQADRPGGRTQPSIHVKHWNHFRLSPAHFTDRTCSPVRFRPISELGHWGKNMRRKLPAVSVGSMAGSTAPQLPMAVRNGGAEKTNRVIST